MVSLGFLRVLPCQTETLSSAKPSPLEMLHGGEQLSSFPATRTRQSGLLPSDFSSSGKEGFQKTEDVETGWPTGWMQLLEALYPAPIITEVSFQQ